MRNMGQSVVVTLNRFSNDKEEEIDIVRQHCMTCGAGFAMNEAYMKGGEGCLELAQLAIDTISEYPSGDIKFTYSETDSIKDKITSVAKNVYGASSVVFKKSAMKALERIDEWGLSNYPVCIAKTQYSLSDDAKRAGVPKDFTFTIRDLVINTGAEMIVAVAGDIMRMPGLPKHPQAERIDIEDGLLVGLE